MLGPPPPEALHVAYWNAEDPDDEIERRIAAACLQHAIDPAELRDRLFLGSRLTGRRRIASVDRNGNVVFDTDMLGEIERLIRELKLGCIILDPMVAFHRIPEGDNTLMEQVIKDGFGDLAARTEVCIELSQHTRKAGNSGRQGDLSADDSRGAGAIVNAARSVRVLNRMTAEEAELPKIAPRNAAIIFVCFVTRPTSRRPARRLGSGWFRSNFRTATAPSQAIRFRLSFRGTTRSRSTTSPQTT